ncbi:MAG: hypothetical protein K2W95_07630 [Candidatus Obscuribacterales bacterium]|nr:hypothetical protein [Candidatus Obscuribacterales bacterium]
MKNLERKSHGVISLFVAGLSLVILLVGFFGVEVWYSTVANSHVRNVCDAASMAAAARIVSAHEEPAVARMAAKKLAYDMLRSSSVLGESLDHITENPNIENLKSLRPGQAVYSVRSFDKSGAENSKSGMKIRVQVAFGAAPFTNKLLGSGTYLVKSEGNSSAARLDLSFCLDNSLSMATDTQVAIIRRELNSSGELVYTELARGQANKSRRLLRSIGAAVSGAMKKYVFDPVCAIKLAMSALRPALLLVTRLRPTRSRTR